MTSYTLRFFQFLVGARRAYTSDTEEELKFLEQCASNCQAVVEVGSFEGVASARIAQHLPSAGRLFLVDPYFQNLMLEKLFNFSMARHVAISTTRPYRQNIQFIRKTSAEAAPDFKYLKKPDLIFIDARHDYNSVSEDFRIWHPMLSDDGSIAFHDSCPCPVRPDLDADVGSVRLVQEIAAGKHGNWSVVQQVNSISLVKKGG